MLPSLKDWEAHLTTAFPEVRLKRFLEMRGADAGPWRLICALPALWVGLLYDAEAQAQAAALVADWTQEEREVLRAEVPRTALATPFRGGTVQDLALQVLAISRGGLERRGRQEGKYLKELEEIAESGVTQVGGARVGWGGSEWGGRLEGWARGLGNMQAGLHPAWVDRRPSFCCAPCCCCCCCCLLLLQADRLLHLYNTEWKHSVEPIYSPEFTY